MDPRARSAYRAIAWGFLVVAAAVLLIEIGERALGFDFFNGNPLPTALFLGGIGGLLLWTVRGDAAAGEAGSADAVQGNAADRGLGDLGSVRPSGGAIDGIPPELDERASEAGAAGSAAGEDDTVAGEGRERRR